MNSPSQKLEVGAKLQVKVEGIGSLGEGLARVEKDEIFIPKAAPGDQIEIQIVEKKKGRYRAQLTALIEASPTRVKERCKHFQICGGCDFQHLPYEDQTAWKMRMTKHWIRRSSLAPLLDKIEFDQLLSPKSYGYRHRTRMQVRNGKIHYFKPHSNDVFELEECPILVEGFFEKLTEAAKSLPETRDWSQSFFEGRLVDGEASYIIDGEKISFDNNCFTQGNLDMNDLLWDRIKADILSLEQRNTVLDLYCGVGNFSVPLSKYFKKVTGVESNLQALTFAQKNSSSVQWLSGLSEQVLLQLEKKREFFDLVLLDPPRTGANAVARILARMMPPNIIYVSCSLESLVQDLVILIKHGGYKISKWTVADMFPQTHHIEAVVSLKR